LVDYLNKKNVRVFGPDKFASQLEGSKAFMKRICKINNIPTANFGVFDNFDNACNFIKKNGVPIVVKADGLAAGKGVSICASIEEAVKNTKEILNGKFKSSNNVVLEEFLEGEELSYFVIVDKNSYRFFGSAQDHKRVGEGDVGPNTGGMGAYSPAPLLTKKIERKIERKIIEPTLKAMKKLGHPYKGFLYAGLMIKKGEPYLIEYNIRMGDPECQVLMMRLESDFLEVIDLATKNKINNLKIKWSSKSSLTVVLCAKGYPSKYIKNSEIKNLSNIVTNKNNQIFHAGTCKKNNKIFSNGGRVLNVTSLSKNLIKARNKSLSNIKKINWPDGFCRRDIGWKAINNK
jgi:phosphoribosylamine--glycine ligase